MSTETTNKKIKIDNGTTFGRTYTDKAVDELLKNIGGGGGGISVIELTDKNGTIASTQLGKINANPQNFAFKYNGKILLFTSADNTNYQYCNNTTSSSENNVMTTSTLLTITSSTGVYTIAENVHNVVANSIHPANGGDLTNIQVGSKVYSIPTDLIASANKLSLGVGNSALGNGVNLDGFTYDEATKTLKASGGGFIIEKVDSDQVVALKPKNYTAGVMYGEIALYNNGTIPDEQVPFRYGGRRNGIIISGTLSETEPLFIVCGPDRSPTKSSPNVFINVLCIRSGVITSSNASKFKINPQLDLYIPA